MAYTIGMLSALDLLLGISVEVILADLPVDLVLKSAILSYEGLLGKILEEAILIQEGVVSSMIFEMIAQEGVGMPLEVLQEAYLDVIALADQLVSSLWEANSSKVRLSENSLCCPSRPICLAI
ncbi:hypothetical protein [Acidithrix sp. C25]|uniref:hypothetical protein n=1 Tax=Acidithrix sp. C25 TaxID=1671482 RepID=UPI00191BAF33|nr:hypothetical protein [Acidithrix sp. C25]